MKQFYATIAANQGGPGYYLIHAETELEARKMISKHTNGRWAFMYKSLDDVHELDRNCLGILGGLEK